eukprot:4416853-Amphidinium_carterae.1
MDLHYSGLSFPYISDISCPGNRWVMIQLLTSNNFIACRRHTFLFLVAYRCRNRCRCKILLPQYRCLLKLNSMKRPGMTSCCFPLIRVLPFPSLWGCCKTPWSTTAHRKYHMMNYKCFHEELLHTSENAAT